MTEAPPLGLGQGLLRLSRGLIAYGVVGLVVAAIGLGALLWVNGRVGSLQSEAATTVARLATTTEQTSEALHDAAVTATTFSTTLDGIAKAVPATSAQIAALRTDLVALESQLRGVNILGNTPLASAADAVGRISASMAGIDTQLGIVAVALSANSNALAANATSLRRLGDSTATLAARLRSGVVEDSLGDVQSVTVVLLLAFTVLSVVPAVGALALGIWLQRELERRARTPEVGVL